jgi:hypothetical protein
VAHGREPAERQRGVPPEAESFMTKAVVTLVGPGLVVG